MTAMRVLLTGSSDWLGRFLAPALRAAGYVVVGFDVAQGADTHVTGSVADRTVVQCAFQDYNIEAVVHAGALHKPDVVRATPRAFIGVNVTGTLNLLEAAIAAGHDRFIFTSTTSVMVTQAIRDEAGMSAAWLDETRRGRAMPPPSSGTWA
jgi:nucleoside-diphosphate-sugar epimerase